MLGHMTGRRERKRERTRRALLDSALSLFAEGGIEATRLEDITDAADLGKGAFYNYFESKLALVADLLSEAIDVLDRRYLKDVAEWEVPADRVAALATRHLEFFDDHPAYLLLFHQTRGLLKLRGKGDDRLRAVFTDYLSRLGRYLPPPDQVHLWDENDRLELAALAAGAIAGYRSFKIASASPPGTEAVVKMLRVGLPPLLDRSP